MAGRRNKDKTRNTRQNKREQQEVTPYTKSNRNKWGNNNNGLLGSRKGKLVCHAKVTLRS